MGETLLRWLAHMSRLIFRSTKSALESLLARVRRPRHFQPAEPMRSEQAIFDELTIVCSSPGYIHAISYLCFRDNVIRYSDEMKAEDMRHMFTDKRLIRTEISTLIGLLIKNDIDCGLPEPEVLQQYISDTEALLEEMHNSMSSAFWKYLGSESDSDNSPDLFTRGAVLREPIFYSGESAYSFQYRDFAPKKYASDNDWLFRNKGFSVDVARDVAHAVGDLLDHKASQALQEMRRKPPESWTFLPCDTFTVSEVADFSGLDAAAVEAVLTAFTLPKSERNCQFASLNDFNIANALPLIPLGDDKFVLFHIYTLTEALYESPFYWMGSDKQYVDTAMWHRGRFTEEFSVECLRRVFGEQHVHPNVELFENKIKVGEIDVLVLYGSRAIVLQAKSKRLTLEARKGNDGQLREDFKRSVQDSCDQAYRCAEMLGDAKYNLKDGNSNELIIPAPIRKVYILCIVSDHYPALAFQVRHFLQTREARNTSLPYVLDVFALDAVTEMLRSPLHLLSYIDRRTGYAEKLAISHELTALSFHLKQNLWLSDEYDFVMLGDDISTDLDLAMLARREGIPAKKTPDGILTRIPATAVGRLISEIEASPNPDIIDLGFMLLTLNEETVTAVSQGIEELTRRTKRDGKRHDLTVGLGKGGTGLTIHCNRDPFEVSGPALVRHCEIRKYSQQAESWFGICIAPDDSSLRFGINLDHPWRQNDELDAIVRSMAKPPGLSAPLKPSRTQKIGRNDRCPCGSGNKYKKCCFPRKPDAGPGGA